MINIKKIASLMALGACLFASQAMAAGGTVHLEPAEIDPDNVSSLQRGARNFMNYCSGCHSAQYVRFNTIGKSLDLSEEQLVDNLMFNAEKTFETIKSSMPPADAARWYGTPPPDMSLMARARTTDYIYNFLKGFYVDHDSPTGVDNRVLAGTSMPHVLWELQGFQTGIFTENENGATVFGHFEPLTSGSMSPGEFDSFVRDTVNFLEYISEPVSSKRRAMGVWVLIFLAFFWVLASMLKKQIWKDVT